MVGDRRLEIRLGPDCEGPSMTEYFLGHWELSKVCLGLRGISLGSVWEAGGLERRGQRQEGQ